ncbi:MAG: hypothetical protein K2P81_03320 [Bacteriovoracaceae bacterium]|nr:hypothetical protein [Bacteriovoracaceae bacterium]
MNLAATVAFIAALIFGYGTEWAARYVKLFNSSNVHILNSMDQYKTKCESLSTENSDCTTSYKIPLHRVTKELNWLGTGSIISATRYICSNGKIIKEYDDPMSPGQRFDLMTIYQSVEIPRDCGNYINVEAWSRHGAVRKGHLNGSVVIGTKESITAVSKLYEFFTIEFTKLLAYLFIFVGLIQMLAKNFYDKEIKINPFTEHIGIWCLFLVFASNLGQTILPIQTFPQIFNKIVSLSSGFAHFLPILSYLLVSIKTEKINKVTRAIAILTLLTYSALNFTYFFPTALITLISIVSITSLALGIKFKKEIFIFYSFLTAIAVLKIMNVPNLPSSMTTSIFIGFYLSYESMCYIKKLSLLIGRVTKLTNSNEKLNDSNIEDFEVELIRLLNVEKLTYLYILPESRCEIRSYSIVNNKVSKEIMFREELPPVFAHVISTREALWNASSKDQKIKSIKSKKNNNEINYQKDTFSVVPMINEQDCFGAFAFTNYKSENSEYSGSLFDQRLIAEISVPSLISKIKQTKMEKEMEHYQGLHELESSINAITTKQDMKGYTQELITQINKLFNSHGFIGELDHETRQVHVLAIENYIDEIKERYINGKVFAHKDNEQGPLPISINKKKIILIQDVSLHSGVFHEFTNYFFKLSKTNSCVSIPIYCSMDSTNKKIWGVIFLEVSENNHFKMSMKPIFEKLSNIISNAISVHLKEEKHLETQKALETFIPEEHLDTYIKNLDARQVDTGVLIMMDLKSSTKISNTLGKEAWIDNVEKEIKPFIIQLCKKHNLAYKNFTWDAFYITLSTAEVTIDEVKSIILFLSEASQAIDEFYVKHFAKHFYEFLNPNTPKARYCISYGDISMGIVESQKNQWAITGQEMANLTKLESLAKTIQKENPYRIIFTDDSLNYLPNLIETKFIVPENGRRVFSLNFNWDEIKDYQKQSQNLNTKMAKAS